MLWVLRKKIEVVKPPLDAEKPEVIGDDTKDNKDSADD